MRKLFTLIIILLLANCSFDPNQPKIILKKSSWKALSNWNDDDHLAALESFKNSCPRFTSYKLDQEISSNFKSSKPDIWQKICGQATNIADLEQARKFFEDNFNPYLVTDRGNAEGLFTGYYEIDLNGSYAKSEKYNWPIYRLPEKIEPVRHYLEHKHINNGFLVGRNLEILYVDSPVDLFFMHIQGSGIVNLEDGRKVRIGYHGQNGHKYFAIGKYLIDEVKIDKSLINADFIRQYLANSPQAREIMELNPSYIFFKINDNIAPIGSFGNMLVPERSLAVDKKYIPLGFPIWLETSYPKTNIQEEKPFNKLVMAQDTGGAIKGIVRGDIFFGNGDLARKYSSNMKQKGKYYILLPKNKI